MIAARDSVDAPGVADLLARHVSLMQAGSPPESCHVQTGDALVQDGAILVSVRENGAVLAIGALKRIGPAHGELKSMHTAREARGRGLGRAVLAALMAEARAQGLTRLSLETGSSQEFAPARALYAAEGFVECPAFGDYKPDPLSVFMSRTL